MTSVKKTEPQTKQNQISACRAGLFLSYTDDEDHYVVCLCLNTICVIHDQNAEKALADLLIWTQSLK